MNDELKSPLSEIDSAAGQHAKRGGSAFAKATARQVRSRQRLEGSLSGGGETPLSVCGRRYGGAREGGHCGNAKRLECVQLAGAIIKHGRSESGSKLHALQTLRAQECSQRTRIRSKCHPLGRVSSLLTLVSGGFLFSGSCPVNAARTLAVSPAKSGARGRRRPGKTQFTAQARPSSFFALAHGTRGLVAWRSIACQAVKRLSISTVKLGTAVLFSEPPGPWSARSANCSPCGWRWTSICFSGPSTSQHSFTPATA